MNFTMRDINLWKKNVARGPNATSGIIFNEARLQKKDKPHQSFHSDNSFDEKYD